MICFNGDCDALQMPEEDNEGIVIFVSGHLHDAYLRVYIYRLDKTTQKNKLIIREKVAAETCRPEFILPVKDLMMRSVSLQI